MHPPPIYPQLPHFHNHGLVIPFHFIWKEIFEECFSPHLSSKFQSSERDGALKERERESIEKKGNEKEKLQESLQIKRESQYFERRKTFQLQNLLTLVHFLPLHLTIFKTLSKIIWESFITLFGLSFNLAICMTWVVSFVFTHELHIFSFKRVGWKRNICWAKVRKHTPKRVPDCLRLRNHIIFVTIFSPMDFKKRLSRKGSTFQPSKTRWEKIHKMSMR
jgi:hypothetical protein